MTGTLHALADKNAHTAFFSQSVSRIFEPYAGPRKILEPWETYFQEQECLTPNADCYPANNF